MKTLSSLKPWLISGLLLAFAPACSSSDKTSNDAASPVPDTAGPGPGKDSAVGDGPVALDSRLVDTAPTASEAGPNVDSKAPGDGSVALDSRLADTTPTASEAGPNVDSKAPDAAPRGLDASLDSDVRLGDTSADLLASELGPSSKDVSPDQAAGGFDPGPVVPLVVNSGPTGSYNLASGTWKVFSFDAEADQVYSISGLGGGVNGYLGPSASVSPTNSQANTDTDGRLSFIASATQRYFLAVAAQGAGASGSFQVADGGRLLAIGKQTVSLTATTANEFTFFHFPISAGHTYRVLLTGQSKDSIDMGLSARAERASNRQFSFPQGRGTVIGWLPMYEDIPATSVVESYSGFYYLLIRVYSDTSLVDLSITVTQTS